MTILVSVYLDKVVCREPESITSPDFFQLVTTVITDVDVKSDFDIEMKRLRRDETATYARPIFTGYANLPMVGIVILGFDIDNNSAWTKNEAAIRKATGTTEDKIKNGKLQMEMAQGNVFAFIKQFIVEAIDIIVSMDYNDRVLDWSELVPLSGGYGSPKTLWLEARTKDPGSAGADYSVYLRVTFEQLLTLSDKTASKVWEACKIPDNESHPNNWLGRWLSTGGPPDEFGVTVEISKNEVFLNTLNVSVTEWNSKSNQQVITTSDAVPISRIFVEMGLHHQTQRELESEEPVNVYAQMLQAGLGGGIKAPTEGDIPALKNPSFTRFSVEANLSSKTISKHTLSDQAYGVEKITFRQQVGTDFLWLNNQAILEICRVMVNGTFSHFSLIYLRPVMNILHREGVTYQFGKTLERSAL